MPYIKPETRSDLEDLLRPLMEFLSAEDDSVVDGKVNYCLTRILHAVYQPASYFRYNRAIGVIECVKQELYRRRVAPYEDSKIAENGDVP